MDAIHSGLIDLQLDISAGPRTSPKLKKRRRFGRDCDCSRPEDPTFSAHKAWYSGLFLDLEEIGVSEVRILAEAQ